MTTHIRSTRSVESTPSTCRSARTPTPGGAPLPLPPEYLFHWQHVDPSGSFVWLQYFELLGKVIAKSLYDGVQLDVHFCSTFYKSLLGAPLCAWRTRPPQPIQSHHAEPPAAVAAVVVVAAFADLELVDVELFKSLVYLRDNLIDDQFLCLYFTASYDEFGVPHEDELKPGGLDIEVCSRTRVVPTCRTLPNSCSNSCAEPRGSLDTR